MNEENECPYCADCSEYGEREPCRTYRDESYNRLISIHDRAVKEAEVGKLAIYREISWEEEC